MSTQNNHNKTKSLSNWNELQREENLSENDSESETQSVIEENTIEDLDIQQSPLEEIIQHRDTYIVNVKDWQKTASQLDINLNLSDMVNSNSKWHRTIETLNEVGPLRKVKAMAETLVGDNDFQEKATEFYERFSNYVHTNVTAYPVTQINLTTARYTTHVINEIIAQIDDILNVLRTIIINPPYSGMIQTGSLAIILIYILLKICKKLRNTVTENFDSNIYS